MSETNEQLKELGRRLEEVAITGILRSNLEEAITVLAPKFDISDEELKSYPFPQINIIRGKQLIEYGYLVHTIDENSALYNPHDKVFLWGIALISNIPAIGEESSHFLHLELNPIHKQKFQFLSREYWTAMNLMELVGCYGKFLYASKKGEKVQIADDIWPRDAMANPAELTAEYLISVYTHQRGYRRAERIFNEYGDLLLPRIARMSPQEALEVLPRLAPVSLYEKRILPILDRVRRAKIGSTNI